MHEIESEEIERLARLHGVDSVLRVLHKVDPRAVVLGEPVEVPPEPPPTVAVSRMEDVPEWQRWEWLTQYHYDLMVVSLEKLGPGARSGWESYLSKVHLDVLPNNECCEAAGEYRRQAEKCMEMAARLEDLALAISERNRWRSS